MFTVYETQAFHVDRCKEVQAQEARGVFGCHYSDKCPDCRIVPEGIEYWGENGHKQGTFPEPVGAEFAARKGWTVKPGGRVVYVGRNL